MTFFFLSLKVLTGESINFRIKREGERERERLERMYTTTVTTRHSEEKKEENRTVEEDVEPVPLAGKRSPARLRIIWRNVIGIIVLHFLAVYGFVNGYRDAKLWTWIWSEYTILFYRIYSFSIFKLIIIFVLEYFFY